VTFGSLFAGIGGFDLGLERAGMECKWQVEIDDFCNRVLEKHWPHVKRYRDVREVGKHNLEPVDLICGGFPCQDISLAGKAAGITGERSGLWSEYARIVGEMGPRYVLVENVTGLLKRGMGEVIGTLASLGYDAEWDRLPAGYFGAPHLRERIFILAYPNQVDGEKGMGVVSDGKGTIFTGRNCEGFPIWLQAASQFIGMDDGISARTYEERVGSLGNAVVPQVVEIIGRAIMEAGKP